MFESFFEIRASVASPTPRGGPGHELGTLARAARIARAEGNHRKLVRIAILLGVPLAGIGMIIALHG